MAENVRLLAATIPFFPTRSDETQNEAMPEENNDSISLVEGSDFLKRLESSPRSGPETEHSYPAWISRWAQYKGKKLLRGIQDEMRREDKTVSGKAVFEIVLQTDGTVAIRLASYSDSLAPHADSLAVRFVNRALATLGEWPAQKEPVVFKAIFLL